MSFVILFVIHFIGLIMPKSAVLSNIILAFVFLYTVSDECHLFFSLVKSTNVRVVLGFFLFFILLFYIVVLLAKMREGEVSSENNYKLELVQVVSA